MKIIFFETQDWERELLEKQLPESLCTQEKLTQENVEQYKDAEVISCFIYSQITKEIIDKLPKLKYLATRSTGFDHIDISACDEKNIPVSNVPEYGSNTVAEFTFALLMDLTRKVTQSVIQAKQLNFDHTQLRGVDLCGKTIGIIGFGKIGRNVLEIAKGYKMNVQVYTHSQDPDLAKTLGFTYTDLPILLQTSDVITLHLPLTKETTHIINQENILQCKKGSFLINTARGGLVDTKAIVLGLEKDILAGVGLDVLEGEDDLIDEVAILHGESQNVSQMKTLLYDHILLNHPKVLITPHNAFNSQEALLRILHVSLDNIKSFLDNKEQNIVTGK